MVNMLFLNVFWGAHVGIPGFDHLTAAKLDHDFFRRPIVNILTFWENDFALGKAWRKRMVGMVLTALTDDAGHRFGNPGGSRIDHNSAFCA